MSLKLGHKILIVSAVPLAFILGLIFAVNQMYEHVVAAEAWADHANVVIAAVRSLSQDLLSAQLSIRGLASAGDPKLAHPYDATAAQVDDDARQLKRLVTDDPSQKAAAAELAQLADKIMASSARMRSLSAGSRTLSRFQRAATASNRLSEAFGRRIDRFVAEEHRADAVRVSALWDAWNRLNALLIIGAIAVCCLTIALVGLLTRSIVRRLSKLSEEAARYTATGEFAACLQGQDEIAHLDQAFHDMTKSLSERQAALTRYKLLAQHARDPILFVRRHDARILDANDAAERAYGYSHEELISMSAGDLRDPETLSTLESALAAADHGTLIESRHRRKDGTIFPAEVSAQGATIGGERIILAIVRDITERKRLQHERERYFELSNDPMCVASLDGRFVRVNPALASTLGFTEAELLAMESFMDLVHPGDYAAVVDALRTLDSGEETVAFEVRSRCKDGSYKSLLWDSVPAGEDGLIYATGRDITAQKAAQAALAEARDRATEASRLKSQFLANMSHEIRTPMNGVIGMTELLLATPLNNQQAEYAIAIRESSAALLAIINEILDFSKLEAGKLELEIIDFSPLSVAESVAELLASQARPKSLAVQAFVAPAVPRSLRGDPGRLRQILINLMGNGIKFTDTGHVTLRVTKEAEQGDDVVLRFAVTDTGIGVSQAARPRLFQPFTQADGSTTRHYGGTGLGLSISKRLVELMRGCIGVDSEEHKGSTFWFTAPFARGSTAASEPAQRLLRGQRALIVDDDDTAREIIHAYILSWGMRNGQAASGAEALEILSQAAQAGDPYELAIIDFWMPHMIGFALARSVRSNPLLSKTKLILLTVLDSARRAPEILNAGFAAYLTKPVKQSQLFDCIASVIGPGEADFSSVQATANRLPSRHAGVRIFGRVLVAEDNAINQRVALAQLKQLGIEADVVKNGYEAVDAVASKNYSLVLMDCQMPDMDGFEAARAIRQAERVTKEHVSIVAMTANALEGDRDACIAAGMDDYLSKPVQLDKLQATIARWLPAASTRTA